MNDMMFLSMQEAVETFMRNGFEFTEDKKLVLNNMEARIVKIGTSVYRSTVIVRSSL